MKTDISSLRSRLIEEGKGYVSAPKQADEFSVKDFQDANRVGYHTGRDALESMVKDGKVEKRKAGARVYYKFTKQSKIK